MEKKITKKEQYRNIYAIVETSNASNKTDLLSFIDHEIELLEKKTSKNTMTAMQKANVKVMEVIKTVLGSHEEPMTVSEMLKDDRLSDYSNQKLSALLRKLIEVKEVTKIVDKKVSRFALV